MDQFSNQPGIKYVHTNCRSLYRKLDEIIFIYRNYDFIACTETWLTDAHTESMLTFPGKTLFRLDRQSTLPNGLVKKRGGLCIYIDNKFSKYCKILKSCTLSNHHLELLTISLHKPGLKHMNISVLYKPPKTSAKTVIDLLKGIQQDLIPQNCEFWLLGDFNTDFLSRNNVNTKKYVSFLRNNGLTQLITNLTRPNLYKGTCIDWIVTNSPFVSQSGVSNVLISNHLTVFCIRKKQRENARTIYRTFRDLKKYSKVNFVRLLKSHNWDLLNSLDNPNDQ